MKTHELARFLLSEEDSDISASLDISTGDHDASRRIFSNEFMGFIEPIGGEVMLLFKAEPEDNEGKSI